MHQNIDTVERRPSNIAGGSLVLKCKDFRMIKLDIASTEDLNNVAATLETLITVNESKNAITYLRSKILHYSYPGMHFIF